mmetsp:Transcript_27877/g.24664  ORF Transcript_27877/g.24664 Transcript_27877/m.24664 type:complete len:87 (+) Transcript_27877:373-633(+)
MRIVDNLFEEENHIFNHNLHPKTMKAQALTTRRVPDKLQNIRRFTKLLRYADEPYKFSKNLKSKKNIMKLLSDIQQLPKGRNLVKK